MWSARSRAGRARASGRRVRAWRARIRPSGRKKPPFLEVRYESMSEPLAQAYEREKARNVQLRATLVQLEHVSRMDLPVEPPRDVLPMPKPGDRKYSQVRGRGAVRGGGRDRTPAADPLHGAPSHARPGRRCTRTSAGAMRSTPASRRGLRLAASSPHEGRQGFRCGPRRGGAPHAQVAASSAVECRRSRSASKRLMQQGRPARVRVWTEGCNCLG